MTTDSVLSRQQLLESLQNRTLVVPDLQAVLEEWPQYIHPELDRLRGDLEKRLPEYLSLFFLAYSALADNGVPRLFLEGKRLQKTRAADFSLLIAAWYPYAPYENLKIVLYLYLWVCNRVIFYELGKFPLTKDLAVCVGWRYGLLVAHRVEQNLTSLSCRDWFRGVFLHQKQSRSSPWIFCKNHCIHTEQSGCW